MFHTFATDLGLVHNTTHTTGHEMAAMMIVFHNFHTLILDIQDQQPRENLQSLFYDIPIDRACRTSSLWLPFNIAAHKASGKLTQEGKTITDTTQKLNKLFLKMPSPRKQQLKTLNIFWLNNTESLFFCVNILFRICL